MGDPPEEGDALAAVPTPTPPLRNAFLPVMNATLALLAKLNNSILPAETLSHFAVITGWDKYDSTLALYSKLLGPMHPTITAGGELSNGTYLGKRLYGKCKLSFTQINDKFSLEVPAGDDKPSWWRDVYAEKGVEVHHMGYMMKDELVWSVVKRFEAAGLGKAVSWARFIEDGKPPSPKTGGPGCFVYMDAQKTLGATVEILGRGDLCDGLPDPPAAEDDALAAGASSSVDTGTPMATPAAIPTTPSGNAFLPVNATLAHAAMVNQSILPAETLSHFAVITGWDKYDSTLALYTKLLGPMHPTITAGGELSNGTYLGRRL